MPPARCGPQVNDVPRVDGILERVQIDHTVIDVIVVDERERQPVGRPARVYAPAGAEQDNWQPYEGLDCYAQERALQAAAGVIAALQDGTITGHGTAAHLFRSTTDSRA